MTLKPTWPDEVYIVRELSTGAPVCVCLTGADAEKVRTLNQMVELTVGVIPLVRFAETTSAPTSTYRRGVTVGEVGS